MNIANLKTLPEMNTALARVEKALKAQNEFTDPSLVAGVKELRRALRERIRIFIYRQKAVSLNGRTIRH